MDHKLYTRPPTGLTCPWVEVPNSSNVIGVSVMPDGTIVGIGVGHKLFTRAALTRPWVEVPNSDNVLGVVSIS
jgi:hypothetical protein